MLQFLGATGTVTGSRFLVSTGRSKVLVDCGLYQGLKDLRLRNWEPFPVEPSSIDAVVLTHAHVDHVGYLPALCRDGFGGPVYVTEGTSDLCRIVLPDAGHLQEEEAEYANRRGFSKHDPALPLFTEADAWASLEGMRGIPFHEEVELTDDVSLVLRPAGHILGSSTVTMSVQGRHGPRRVLFSGDLGRPSHPLLRAPEPPDSPDIVVMESTYGDRRHDDDGVVQRLGELISRTVARGGTVIIPAFAVDRTEVVLFHLRELMEGGAVPEVPVYVNSPMALSALGVYRDAISERSPELRPEVLDGSDPFDTGTLVEVREVKESMALDHQRFPSIIVSASGMASGGRVVHHLAARLPDRRNAVALVGFQAEGTRGRLLAEGAGQVKMLGRYVPVRAEVEVFDGLSVHADADELVSWLGSSTGRPECTYLVHGEPEAARTLAGRIGDELDLLAVVPRHLENVRVD